MGFSSGLRFYQGEIRDLARGIFPGFRLILEVDVPEAIIFVGGGSCFFLRGQIECLGV